MSTSQASPEVVRIAQQAEEVSRKTDGKHADTLFYKVVLGGNLPITSQVVNYMEQNEMEETLNWLLNRANLENKPHPKARASKKLLFTRAVVFLLLSIISLLLTPVFYVVHIFTNAFFNQKQKRISANIRLPLAFAAFSQDEEIMQYFLSLGVDVENVDEQGNNVFHYIADLSAVAPDNACKIFGITVKFIDDNDTVVKLLIENRNTAGHTSMEYAVKFGSPLLQMQILKQPNVLQHTAFAVGKKDVRFDDDKDSEKHPVALPDVSTHLEYVDVTMYEAGSLTNQSTLLNLLSDRDVADMSKEDLEIFNPATLFGKWIDLKVKQFLTGIALMTILDLAVTIVLLLIICAADTGTHGNTFIQWKREHKWEATMTEIEHFADDGFGSVLKPEAYSRIYKEKQLTLQKIYLQDFIDDTDKKQFLFNATIEKFPNVSDYYDSSEVNWNISDEDTTTPGWIMDAFYKSAIEQEQFKNDTVLMYVALNFENVAREFAQQIHKDHDDKKDDVTMSNFWGLRTVCGSVYENFAVTYHNDVLVPSERIPCDFFKRVFCIDKSDFNSTDLLLLSVHDDITTTMERISQTCEYKMLLDLASSRTKCGSFKPSKLVKLIQTQAQWLNVQAMDKFIQIMSCLYIFLDIVERCVFMFTCVCKQSSVHQMFVTALSHKVPGSYARKQINVSTYLGIVFTFIIAQLPFDHSIYTYLPYKDAWVIYGLINILCSIFRFVMHIHSLRLLPGIGHFVITTFMMGTNLVNFSTVFGIVLFIFSVLFYILIDDQSCPIEKAEGFETIIASMFSTFRLTFGQGDLNPFFSNTPVKLTYTLYVIIVSLLLMNLIIAIMSTTATEIMADPWRDALWKVEWLDEATSAEYTFSILGLPFRKLTKCNIFPHEKVGYIVKKANNKKSKVYIEVFHCPASD